MGYAAELAASVGVAELALKLMLTVYAGTFYTSMYGKVIIYGVMDSIILTVCIPKIYLCVLIITGNSATLNCTVVYINFELENLVY